MSCKSAIYTADPSSTVPTLSTAAGTAIPLKGQGYFDVDAGVTFTPTAAGATQTVTAAAAGTVSVNIPAIVRNQCCDSTSTLTLVITTAVVVTKI